MSDIVNRVRVLAPSATGTSSAALGSAYSTKYLTPSEAGCIDGRRYTWLIEQGNDVELVEGAWTSSGNTASRTKVVFSKISGTVGTSKINLNGTAVISIVESAEMMGAMHGSRMVTGSTDTIAATDLNRPIIYNRATAIAVALAQAGDSGSFVEGWLTWVQNKGAGAVTITPATSTIDGAATLVLAQNQGALIWSDGTNYQSFAFRGDVGVPVRADAAQSLTSGQKLQVQSNIAIPPTTQSFTTGTAATYTTPAGVKWLEIHAYGGGGSGGGCGATSATQIAASGGGGGGGYVYAVVASPAASYTYTVGQGGAAPTAGTNNGNSGGATTVNVKSISAGGGTGGTAGAPIAGQNVAIGGSGGVASGGDFTRGGAYGGNSVNQGQALNYGGQGGNGPNNSLNSAATAAPAGSHGGGSGCSSDISTAARSGGAGDGGLLIFIEHYS